ncbi:MAG TPA: DUF1501 domain-containing protein [Streptosporangiaceae bacterium]|nr:DUF1501 domain-containing protein [Streptosporangiaceae bacterium]
MDRWTRRKFLTLSGVTAGATLAAGGTALTWDDLMAAARGRPLPGDASILVLVTLYGGNDGLNTVIPAADKAYHDARPDLAYGEGEVLALGEGLGLNPSMRGFKALWEEGRLAIVRGVSYPRPDHSHFRSMAIWQTASPAGPVPTGWLGRWLDAVGHDPLRAIAIEPVLPPLLAGASGAGSTFRLGGGPVLPTGPLGGALAKLAGPEHGEHPLQTRVASSLSGLMAVDTKLRGARPDDEADDDRQAQGASGGGQGKLAQQLDVVAKSIRSGVPARVYSVSLGGFDTHAAEKTTQSRLLGQLDGAVSGFLREVRGAERGRKVVVAVYSEFGRRVRGNANQGTDHGTAGPMFIAGEPVSGGFFGEQPSLTKLADDDLIATTDFRDVYATLLAKTLDTDPARILGAGRKTMDFL